MCCHMSRHRISDNTEREEENVCVCVSRGWVRWGWIVCVIDTSLFNKGLRWEQLKLGEGSAAWATGRVAGDLAE